jgi:iron complex outermembrane receptor protein
MTSFKVRPICAAVMLMTAHAVPAVAQNAGDSVPPAPAPDSLSMPMQTVEVTGLRRAIRSAEEIKRD